ncbi:Helix-turn-helix domain protein [Pirellula sp. SH-Sr6A]|uniref:helix-turn-helix transcriptional regulator n=1 Tax=Pirellula sp. SH-Sr6A TaxID=1632865 RepID=UPI00078DFA56|nr:helix-turn-helix domain-containing protein [Pirellula sp. SH-Sr6A]AMV32771.1 Helix-turn-helix domain protein [Pirellula sp. SH-Sr6A]
MSIAKRMPAIDDRMALRLSEAAMALGISQRTLWGLVKAGEIKSFRASKNIHLIETDELRRWMAQKTEEGIGR